MKTSASKDTCRFGQENIIYEVVIMQSVYLGLDVDNDRSSGEGS